MLAKLYRREHNFYNDTSVTELGKGPNQSYELVLDFENPGWIAFDFAADVADHKDGVMAEGRLDLYVNDTHRFRARGSYTFTRIYVYVDRGKNHFKWETNEDYQSGDEAWLRRINGTSFEPVDEFAVIEHAQPPRRLNEISRHSIVNGYDRFQQSGPGGVEIDLMLTFAPKHVVREVENEDGEKEEEVVFKSSIELYNEFMADFPNFFVLEYNYGIYGGMIIDPQPSNVALLQHVDCVLHSPQRTSVHEELLVL